MASDRQVPPPSLPQEKKNSIVDVCSALKLSPREFFVWDAALKLVKDAMSQDSTPKALNIINEALRREPESHALHHDLVGFLTRMGKLELDVRTKNSHFQRAREVSRTACDLASSRIDYALDHVDLLRDIGGTLWQEEAADFCKAALDVKEPNMLPFSDEGINKIRKALRSNLKECVRYQDKGKRRKEKDDGSSSVSSSELRSKMEKYWRETMTSEMRGEFFKVGEEELKKFCRETIPKNEVEEVMSFLEEALVQLKENNSLIVFECFQCTTDTKFTNASDYLDHQQQVHELFPSLPDHLVCMVPEEVDEEWTTVIRITLLLPINRSVILDDPNSWTAVDDMERSRLLAQVQMLLSTLVAGRSLLVPHFEKVQQFAIDSVLDLFAEPDEEKWAIYLCLLDATNLRKVVQFLDELLDVFSKEGYSSKDEPIKLVEELYEQGEKVTFDSDTSSLVLDSTIFNAEENPEDINLEKLMSWVYDEEAFEDVLRNFPLMNPNVSSVFARAVVDCINQDHSFLVDMCEEKSTLLEKLNVEADDNWRMEEYLWHDDDSIMKIVEADASIIGKLRAAENHVMKILEFSAIDRRKRVVAILKTFLLARILNAMRKVEVERSEAAACELLMATKEEDTLKKNQADKHDTKQKSKKKSKKKKNRGRSTKVEAAMESSTLEKLEVEVVEEQEEGVVTGDTEEILGDENNAYTIYDDENRNAIKISETNLEDRENLDSLDGLREIMEDDKNIDGVPEAEDAIKKMETKLEDERNIDTSLGDDKYMDATENPEVKLEGKKNIYPLEGTEAKLEDDKNIDALEGPEVQLGEEESRDDIKFPETEDDKSIDAMKTLERKLEDKTIDAMKTLERKLEDKTNIDSLESNEAKLEDGKNTGAMDDYEAEMETEDKDDREWSQEDLEDEEKKDFMKVCNRGGTFDVGLEDIKAYCGKVFPPKLCKMMLMILPMAMRLLEEHGTLSGYSCFSCHPHITFELASDYLHHWAQNHDLPRIFQLQVPTEVSSEWLSNLHEIKDPIDHPVSVCTLMLEVAKHGDNARIPEGWPTLADDPERDDLLAKIRSTIFSLGNRRILQCHLDKVIIFARKSLSHLSFGSFRIHLIENHEELDVSLFCLRSLAVPQLEQVLAFLEKLLELYDDKGNSNSDDEHSIDEPITVDCPTSSPELNTNLSQAKDKQSIADIATTWISNWIQRVGEGLKIRNSIIKDHADLKAVCLKRNAFLNRLDSMEMEQSRGTYHWTLEDCLCDYNNHVIQLIKMEAAIRRIWNRIKEEEEKMRECSHCDYTGLIVPLAICFLKEAHANKGTQRSEACGQTSQNQEKVISANT